jgi:hypothetical protein
MATRRLLRDRACGRRGGAEFSDQARAAARPRPRSGLTEAQALMSPQTKPVTFVLIARIPAEGVEDFRAYENAVLPLLAGFNGRLERRLRNPDGTIEMHIVSFASDADFQNYRNDPRRTAQARLLEKSSATLELIPMASV